MGTMRKSVWIGSTVALLSLGASCGLQKRAEDQPAVGAMLRAFPRAEDTAGVSLQPARGLEVVPWATLPGSPIAIAFDGAGSAYVAQTTRYRRSDLEIQAHLEWIDDDLSFRSVEQRRAFLHRVLSPSRSAENESWLEDRNGDGSRDWRDLRVDRERVLRVIDADGDGVADSLNVFAEFPATEITGTGGGVLVHPGGDVFYAMAPDLWRLESRAGQGTAGARTSISHGYGVHFGTSGHGMSGLTVGPDGKVYWKVGDIGGSVVGPDGRKWHFPDEGAVMRANPDGSEFEVFARGLRNTHELAFDEHGNLFGGENDGVDPQKDRILHLVDGSDSGWRNRWQLRSTGAAEYNVWFEDRLSFRPDDARGEGQPAFVTPPVGYGGIIGAAGFVYNPGTALDDTWRDHFFVATFMGTPANSGILAFRVEPHGASFTLGERRPVLKGIAATGLAFAPAGALYAADWIGGWGLRDSGRIWKLDSPAGRGSALRRETAALLAEDLRKRPEERVAALLRHPDMRVRMKGQFELVGRGARGAAWLARAARQREHALARLHGIWGIGQLGRARADQIRPVLPLLRDTDPEVRAQAAKVVGEARYQPGTELLLPLLDDPSAQVRFFAAQASGRIGSRRAVPALVRMLERNDDADAYLRHAGALALARIGDAGAITALASHRSRAVRLAAVVALRHLQHPGAADFLRDPDPAVVAEAARAIHDDSSIPAALPALARMLDRGDLVGEAVVRRAINANLRLGGAEHAQRLAVYAARSSAPEAMRVEALASLGTWPKPSRFDRVEDVPRELGERDPDDPRGALAEVAERVLTARSAAVRAAAATAAGKLGSRSMGPRLVALVSDPGQPLGVRVAALHALAELRHEELPDLFRSAVRDRDPAFRTEAQGLITELGLPGEVAAGMLAAALETGEFPEQQVALRELGKLDVPRAHAVLGEWMDRLQAGTVPPAIQLDLLDAAANASASVQAKVASYRAAKPQGDRFAMYREALEGGSPEAGKKIFFEHSAAVCAVCHTVGDRGGKVGPDLTTIARRLPRTELLRAIVDPSARIAPGYGVVSVRLKSGEALSGKLLGETAGEIVVQIREEQTRRLLKQDVVERTDAPSAMPTLTSLLTPAEIRDVVAYIATLK
jgi:quinoprotein glucose dehydrogenase